MPSRSEWDLSSSGGSKAAGTPFWGPPTAAVNFCEEDYVITRYVAEFFNTVTSIAYVLYGIRGIRRYKRQNVAIFSSPNLSYWSLIGVGVFSGLYHTSLKYHTQMSDELSMHLCIGTILHQIYTFQEPPHIQRRNTIIILGVIVPFVIYHCVTDEFVLHVALFFCMSWLVAFRTRHLVATRIVDKIHREQIRSLVTFASTTALSAYAIWNVDVNFCPTLTRWKIHLGYPWSVLLELHGYWHIMTAISAYTFMSIIEFLLSPQDVQSHGVGFSWPVRAVLAEIAPYQKKVSASMHGDERKAS